MAKTFSNTFFSTKMFLAAALLAAVALLIYADTLDTPFVFDDLLAITGNPGIRVLRFTPESVSGILKSARPLAQLSFALNYRFHAYDVGGYHVFNLIIHIITALLILLVADQTLRLCNFKNTLAVSFFIAALWLVHPLHTQSVTYIVQRMNAMAAMFYMLTFCCFIRARTMALTETRPMARNILYALCLLSAVLGMAAKETAATLPVMLLLYEWFFFQSRKPVNPAGLLAWTGLVILALFILFFFYMGAAPFSAIGDMFKQHNFTLPQRLLTEAGVVVYYISLLFFPFPSRLNLVYDFPLSRTLTDPVTTVAALAALSALFASAVYAARKHPLPAFCILWFLVTLSIESSIFGLDLIFEHRTYLPSIFPVMGAVWFVVGHIRNKTAAVGLLTAVIVIFSAWTFQRNGTWRSALTLWLDNIAKSPRLATPYNNAAAALFQDGRYDEAMVYYKTALQLDPDNIYAYNNLGLVFAKIGLTAKAVACYETAIKKEPHYASAYNNLGLLLAGLGRHREALTYYKTAIRYDPYNAQTYNNLGVELAVQGAYNRAIINYRKALALDPAYAEANFNLGVVLSDNGDYEQALVHYKAAVKNRPDYLKAMNNLGLSYMALNYPDKAIEHYLAALKIDPDYENALNNLGAALADAGQTEYTAARLPENLRLPNRLARIYNSMASAFLRQGRIEQATTCYYKALDLKPDFNDALFNLGVALMTEENYREAARVFYKSITLDPKDTEARDKYNLCLKRMTDQGHSAFSPEPLSDKIGIEPDRQH